eukprot:m.53255 g.53255  ORF g.53255 m.53255 type:complete len:75 (-) comp15440_c0_seq6:375-599(-)
MLYVCLCACIRAWGAMIAIAECSALRRELFSLKQRLTDTYSSVPREPVVRSAYRDAGDGGRAGVFQQTVCIVSG